MNDISMTTGYSDWLKELKARIRSVQVKAALAASRDKKFYEFFVRFPAAIEFVPRAGAQLVLPAVLQLWNDEADSAAGMEPAP